MTVRVPGSLDVFYPIVPDAGWLERLVPLGIKTVQLRIKDEPAAAIVKQIKDSLAVAREHDCQLIVNDHWREAIKAGADFIHLGQEDLKAADLTAIKAANVRVGISTHTAGELEVALRAKPDYIAIGPIYETKLKKMRWTPQGVANIRKWRLRIGHNQSLVAIGGITPERAPRALGAGADSVAVVTDFMTSPHPEARVKLWLEWAETQRGP